MKRKLQLLGISLILGSFSLTAQTTHNIDWSMAVGANATITVEVGDEIVWTNIEATVHDVVSSHADAPGTFGSGDLGNGDTYSFTFTDTRQFTYLCSYHPATMGGVITVVENLDCMPPTDVGVDNITDTSADFFWQASADETGGYSWVIMNQGDDPDTDTPVDTGVEASGSASASSNSLTADTDYEFYIETDCGNDGNSGYSSAVPFTTDNLGLTQNKLEGFKLYPNPASETINLDAKENIENVSIYNMTSQKVMDYNPSDNMTSVEMNVSNLDKGTYFIEVSTGNKIGVYKFIKR
ncbi:MAG: T9SS type A sorting domain-containing protein [Brumimicrobium sp.]